MSWAALVCAGLSWGCSDPAAGPGSGGQSGAGNAGNSGNGGSGGGAGGQGTGAAAGVSGTGAVGSGGQAGSGSGGSGTGGAGNAGTGGSGGAPTVNLCSPALSAGSVAFSVPSSTFSGQLSVTLSTTVAGAEIRYTVDGSAPGASSTLYASPVSITGTTQLRAQAFVQGAPSGVIATALYVARAFDQTHDIPLLVLDSYGSGALSRMNREFVDVGVLAWSAGGGALSSQPDVASRAGFHVRGQSSATFDKTPYRLELRDNAGGDLDCPLFGMPAESDWALVGPFPDKTLIRNAFVYGLGRDMGMAAPRVSMVELYLNVANRPLEAGDYMGVYQVVETIKNQRDRLNLQQLKEQDVMLPALTGGYIFKFEWLAAEEPILTCTGSTQTCWADLELVDPEPLQPEQRTWITQHLQAFHDVINGGSFADPTTGYAAYIDPDSFVDQIIINEATRNMDAYVRSQYFHKDRDGKIFAGPLWDFDLTMGVGGAFDNLAIDGWQYEENAMRRTSNWFQRLLSDPAFQARLATRWRELRQGLLSDAQIDARLAALTAGLSGAADRNFARWNNLTSQMVGPFRTPTVGTWQGQVSAMRDWLVQRMQWLDTQWQ